MATIRTSSILLLRGFLHFDDSTVTEEVTDPQAVPCDGGGVITTSR